MKTILLKGAALTAALVVASQASAASFACTAPAINRLYQSASGGVFVGTDFGTFNICSVSSTSGGVAAASCQAWLSELLSARGLNKPVIFYFDTADPINAGMTAPYCVETNFNWSARVPYFIEVQLDAP